MRSLSRVLAVVRRMFWHRRAYAVVDEGAWGIQQARRRHARGAE